MLMGRTHRGRSIVVVVVIGASPSLLRSLPLHPLLLLLVAARHDLPLFDEGVTEGPEAVALGKVLPLDLFEQRLFVALVFGVTAVVGALLSALHVRALVVRPPLLRIRQGLVGRCDELEGPRGAALLIRVVLQAHHPVGLLQLLLRRVRGHSQHPVEVAVVPRPNFLLCPRPGVAAAPRRSTARRRARAAPVLLALGLRLSTYQPLAKLRPISIQAQESLEALHGLLWSFQFDQADAAAEVGSRILGEQRDCRIALLHGLRQRPRSPVAGGPPSKQRGAAPLVVSRRRPQRLAVHLGRSFEGPSRIEVLRPIPAAVRPTHSPKLRRSAGAAPSGVGRRGVDAVAGAGAGLLQQPQGLVSAGQAQQAPGQPQRRRRRPPAGLRSGSRLAQSILLSPTPQQRPNQGQPKSQCIP
mmetsp:Transcript_170134/g.540193  ORF Transcript_170134/g.540193 Transcript_170134/m.540193 type:complete len:412 (+) Transcript_170134:80-1315(+)